MLFYPACLLKLLIYKNYEKKEVSIVLWKYLGFTRRKLLNDLRLNSSNSNIYSFFITTGLRWLLYFRVNDDKHDIFR